MPYPYSPIQGSAVPGQSRASTGIGYGRAGSTMGPIYQFGQANPYGPYATLNRGGAGSAPTAGGGGRESGSGGDSVARQYLTGVVQGQNTPYNEATRASMYSQQSGMAGAAEAGRNQQLAEQAAVGGASPSDPGYQRLIRQSMAQRQAQNQQSMGDIERTANLANQAAQSDAASRLLGSEDERFALQQGFNQRATQMAMGYLYGGGGGGSTGEQYGTGFLGYGSGRGY